MRWWAASSGRGRQLRTDMPYKLTIDIPWSKMDREEKDRRLKIATKLLEDGMSWADISRQVSVHPYNLMFNILDAFKVSREVYRKSFRRKRREFADNLSSITGEIGKLEKRRRDRREAWKKQKSQYRKANWTAPPRECRIRAEDKAYREQLERLILAIPEDTRSTTARLMGDPLVGRRAIDQEKHEGKRQ